MVGVHQLGIGNPLLELKTAASATAGSRPAAGAAGDTLNEVAGLWHKAGLATKTEEMAPPKPSFLSEPNPDAPASLKRKAAVNGKCTILRTEGPAAQGPL
jgi:hypothetical protein